MRHQQPRLCHQPKLGISHKARLSSGPVSTINLLEILRKSAPSVPPPVEMPPPPPQARPSLDARKQELSTLLQANDVDEYRELFEIASKNLKLKTQQHEEAIKEVFETKKKIASLEQENVKLKVIPTQVLVLAPLRQKWKKWNGKQKSQKVKLNH